MKAAGRTKKFLIAATLTTALGFAGLQAASASPGAAGPTTPGMQHPCPMQQTMQAQMMGQKPDPEMLKKRDAFLTQTKEIRKNMAEKRAAMRALMHSENPDTAQASKLAGELFELREQMRTKATEAGLPGRMMMGMMGPMGMHPGCNFGPMKGRGHHAGGMM